MFEWAVLLFFFVLGLLVGSYLNVLVLRFGFYERANPRSECAQCSATLQWFDLIPLISYFILRGKCRVCGSALSLQYPFVEGFTGLLFVLAYLFYAPHFTLLSVLGFLSLLLFLSASVVVVVYDLKHTLVPLPFVYAAAFFAFTRRATEAVSQANINPIIDGVSGGLLLFLFFAAISLITRERGMGFGDAYVAGSLGVLLGVVDGVNAMTLGVWSGAIVYLLIFFVSQARLLSTQSRVTMKTELPFAPWLLVGALLVLFTGLSAFRVGQGLSRFFV